MADSDLVPPGAPKEVADRILEIAADPSTSRVPHFSHIVGAPADFTCEAEPENRIVLIGDSLTHGFQSGAIFNTDLSYGAIIAHELGWLDYRFPPYPGFGG